MVISPGSQHLGNLEFQRFSNPAQLSGLDSFSIAGDVYPVITGAFDRLQNLLRVLSKVVSQKRQGVSDYGVFEPHDRALLSGAFLTEFPGVRHSKCRLTRRKSNFRTPNFPSC